MLLVGRVMGALDFSFLWLFPAQQQRAEGRYGNAPSLSAAGNAWSPLERAAGEQEGGLSVGTRLASLLLVTSCLQRS